MVAAHSRRRCSIRTAVGPASCGRGTPEFERVELWGARILPVIRLAVLGSTGSIGTQTLDVVRHHPDRLRVVALAAGSNARGLREQADEFGVGRLALCDEAAASAAGIPGGNQAVSDLAADAEVDLVVVAVAG
ncbi:MAG: hypothetical protein H3C58_05075, partial [Fimbriimonadaceae bacterium]|nr:hypothetical protein [Fimbriimonadaceae bacterium]